MTFQTLETVRIEEIFDQNKIEWVRSSRYLRIIIDEMLSFCKYSDALNLTKIWTTLTD